MAGHQPDLLAMDRRRFLLGLVTGLSALALTPAAEAGARRRFTPSPARLGSNRFNNSRTDIRIRRDLDRQDQEREARRELERQRVRERASLRARAREERRRKPGVQHDYLGRRLHRDTPEFGTVRPGFDNNVDVQNRVTAPAEGRLQPNGFEDLDLRRYR